MKHFLYHIILMAGIALLLTSCTDDPLLDDSEGSGNVGGNGDHLSLTMNLPLLTKATGVDKGSNAEIMIDGIRLVLYKGNIVAHCWDLDIQLNVNSNDINVTGNDLRTPWKKTEDHIIIQTKAKELKPDNYKMLIIINPNNAIKRITEEGGGLLSAIENGTFDATVTTNMYQTVNNEAAHFLMLNHQGLIQLTNSNFYESAEKAEYNPVQINVERAVAKISSEYTGPTTGTRSTAVADFGRFVMLLDYNNQLAAPWGDDYDIPEDCIKCPVYGCPGYFDRETKKCDAKPHIHTYDGLGLVTDRVRYMVATDLTWEVDVVNKSSYWLRHLTNMANGTMEKQGQIDREKSYAEDPNFTSASNANFSYITSEDALNPDATDSKAKRLSPPIYTYSGYWGWTTGDDAPVYIPENTMVQSEQKGDRVTRVIFKAILKREVFGKDKTNEKPTKVEQMGDFFVFKGGDKNIEDYKYNNYDKNNNTFYILRPEDVKIYASATTTENIHIYLRDGILDAIAKFKQDNPSFNWDDLSANTNPATSDKLSFYKNGEMFYEAPIEHFPVAEPVVSVGGYGRFGVVRNNWYKLNIQNIVSIGTPTIPPVSSDLIESPSTRSSTPETKSSSNSLIRNQSIIF